MKILSFSYCFPNSAHPTWGVFVAQRLAALSELAQVQAVSPVPVFPLVSRMRGQLGPRRDRFGGLDVHRPRFFYLPGVFKGLDGKFYACGLRTWLRRFCDQWRADVLDAHFVWPDGVGVSMLADQLGIPYTITLRGQIYPCADDSRRRQCEQALRGAAAVISLSAPMADVARDMGVADDRISVIPNGVDTDHFRLRDKADSRRRLGLPLTGRLIVTVAHLGARKGHHEMLRALVSLPDDVKLVLVGGGDSRPLASLVDELKLTGRVILAGPQPYDKVPLYFNAADVSVLASYREGCPNVVLESLASGTPVVASDVGSVAEMITSPAYGRVVPARQVGPLAEALREMLANLPAPQTVAAAGAVKSWQQVAHEVHAVMEKVVAGQPAISQQKDTLA